MLNCGIILITYALFFLLCVVKYATTHILVDLQVTSFAQILYNLDISQSESASEVWADAVSGFFEAWGGCLAIVGFLALAGCAISVVLWRQKRKSRTEEEFNASRKTNRSVFFTSVSLLVCACLFLTFQVNSSLNQLGYYKYIEQKNETSNFYELYYVEPTSSVVKFPAKKKNLIYIYLESMETSYADTASGGQYEINYIPNLTKLALENNCFGDGTSLNGGITAINTTWTIAAMLAQTSGTPYVYSDGDASAREGGMWGDDEVFLAGLVTMGDLLEDNGYSNYLSIGSKGAYAGRLNYFQQHGNYTIYDYNYYNENDLLPYKDYYVWWGMEDMYLLENSKDLILEAAAGDEPFNFTMLTVDTHFPGGYLCSQCQDTYDEDMKNVISCADSQVYEFIQWIQQQDFYEDTVIVISGDHYSMDTDLGNELQEEDRRTYLTVINGPDYTGSARTFTTMDLFPTTLAALNVTISGDRLGLGTNLYASRATLAEEIGMEEINEEIPKSSDYYVSRILNIQEEEEGNPSLEVR